MCSVSACRTTWSNAHEIVRELCSGFVHRFYASLFLLLFISLHSFFVWVLISQYIGCWLWTSTLSAIVLSVVRTQLLAINISTKHHDDHRYEHSSLCQICFELFCFVLLYFFFIHSVRCVLFGSALFSSSLLYFV